MTRVRLVKTNFTAGEVSRRLLGRGDLRAYENGALALRNVFIHPTGGVTRRSGLAFVESARGPGRLAAFEFNTEQVYLLVFTDGMIDVFQEDTHIDGVVAPWTAAQLDRITWTQSADTLLICHPDVEPRTLTRDSASQWTLGPWVYVVEDEAVRMPFYRFAPPEVTLASDGTTGAVTVIASAPVFDPQQEGARIRIRGRQLLVTGVASATEVQATVQGEALPDTAATVLWDEQAFSPHRGWPVSAAFHQDRLVIGGSRDLPNRLWLSRSADLWNFDLGTGRDDEAKQFSTIFMRYNNRLAFSSACTNLHKSLPLNVRFAIISTNPAQSRHGRGAGVVADVVVERLRDGAIVLYKRSDTKKAIISYRLRLPGETNKYERKSTGFADVHNARRVAEERYDQLVFRRRRGLSAFAPKFSKMAQEYLAHVERRVAEGTLSKTRAHTQTTIINHYLIPYFGDMAADEVTKAVVKQYHQWRRDIYAGKAPYPDHVRQSRNKSRTYTANAETFNNTVLNLIFDRAAEANLLAPAEKLKLARVGNGGKRRGYFTDQQVEQIYAEMQARIDAAGNHAYRRHYAVVFYHYVNILLHTGMRVGELRSLRWCDVVPFHKGGTEYCELRVAGKTGKRTMVALPEAVVSFEALRAFYKEAQGSLNESALCIANFDGTSVGSFHLQFARILHKLGTKQDQQGQQCSIYSLRHTYITKRLLAGVNIHLLARNCGTSVRQIETNYDHVIPRMRVEELVQLAG